MKKNNKRVLLKWSTAIAWVLATALNALAQSNANTSPAGEPPLHVRNGRATLVGHFSVPTQMRRLALVLVTPHPAEEEQFLEDLMKPGSPQFHEFLTADSLVLTFNNVRELAAPLAQGIDALHVRYLLQKLETLPISYLAEVSIPTEEVKEAVRAFNSTTEFSLPP